MALAEIEVYHSRPIAPTRRVALGDLHLPVDPAPGAGGILLAGVVTTFLPLVDPDLHDDVLGLCRQLERGERIPQPRLRHRYQADRVGLTCSRHSLERFSDGVRFRFERGKGAPAQQVLGAVYAAGDLPAPARGDVMAAIRKGIRWHGEADRRFIAHLGARADGGAFTTDPLGWALQVLGLEPVGDRTPDRQIVLQRFRTLLRTAHPDHGGEADGAAARIAELTEARRILLT